MESAQKSCVFAVAVCGYTIAGTHADHLTLQTRVREIQRQVGCTVRLVACDFGAAATLDALCDALAAQQYAAFDPLVRAYCIHESDVQTCLSNVVRGVDAAFGMPSRRRRISANANASASASASACVCADVDVSGSFHSATSALHLCIDTCESSNAVVPVSVHGVPSLDALQLCAAFTMGASAETASAQRARLLAVECVAESDDWAAAPQKHLCVRYSDVERVFLGVFGAAASALAARLAQIVSHELECVHMQRLDVVKKYVRAVQSVSSSAAAASGYAGLEWVDSDNDADAVSARTLDERVRSLNAQIQYCNERLRAVNERERAMCAYGKMLTGVEKRFPKLRPLHPLTEEDFRLHEKRAHRAAKMKDDVKLVAEAATSFLSANYEFGLHDEIALGKLRAHFAAELLGQPERELPKWTGPVLRSSLEDWIQQYNAQRDPESASMKLVFGKRPDCKRSMLCVNMRARSEPDARQTWATAASALFAAPEPPPSAQSSRKRARAQTAGAVSGALFALSIDGHMLFGYVPDSRAVRVVAQNMRRTHELAAVLAAQMPTDDPRDLDTLLAALSRVRPTFADAAAAGVYVLAGGEVERIFRCVRDWKLDPVSELDLGLPSIAKRVRAISADREKTPAGLEWEQHGRRVTAADGDSLQRFGDNDVVSCFFDESGCALKLRICGVQRSIAVTMKGVVFLHAYELCDAVLGPRGECVGYTLKKLMRAPTHFDLTGYIKQSACFPEIASVTQKGRMQPCVAGENVYRVVAAVLWFEKHPSAVERIAGVIVRAIGGITADRVVLASGWMRIMTSEMEDVDVRVNEKGAVQLQDAKLTDTVLSWLDSKYEFRLGSSVTLNDLHSAFCGAYPTLKHCRVYVLRKHLNDWIARHNASNPVGCIELVFACFNANRRAYVCTNLCAK